MNKKLKELLKINKEWLENENMNYNKEHFKNDFKKLLDNINESHYLGLISDNVYKQCKETFQEYMSLCI